MNSDPTDRIDLDIMLEKHFTAKLDGQTGGSRRAFAAYHRAANRRGWIRRGFSAAAIAATAAMIAMALRIHTEPRPIPPRIVSEKPTGTMEQLVWSQTTDDGIVFLDGHTPARKLVRQRVREMRWTDPNGVRHIQSLTPETDVMLISLDKY